LEKMNATTKPPPCIIPVPNKKAGDWAEFGGMLGGAPVMAVNPARSDVFVNRGGGYPRRYIRLGI